MSIKSAFFARFARHEIPQDLDELVVPSQEGSLQVVSVLKSAGLVVRLVAIKRSRSSRGTMVPFDKLILCVCGR